MFVAEKHKTVKIFFSTHTKKNNLEILCGPNQNPGGLRENTTDSQI